MMADHRNLTRRRAIHLGLATASLGLAAPFVARTVRAAGFPGARWPSTTPESVGLRLAKLEQAQRYAEQHGGGAGCVIRHGHVAHAWGASTERYQVQSATKSWGSVMLGLACDDGKVAIGDRARDHLADFASIPESNLATGWLEQITLDHLATHTAGFPEPTRYGELVVAPGSKWIYSNCGSNWLANVLTNVYRRDLREVARERLLAPMDLTDDDAHWRTPAYFFTRPVDGLPATEFNGGMRANVNAMARFGYMLLHGGRWGEHRIVSRAYLDLATAPAFDRLPLKTLKRYGLLWWNNANGRMAGVPRDTFYAFGKNANAVIVIPSLDMVVVRIGNDGWTNHGGSTGEFLQPLVDAVA